MMKKTIGILLVLLLVLCFGAAAEAENEVTLTVSPNTDLLLYQEVTYTVEAQGATNVQIVYENVTYGYESTWDLNELNIEPTEDGKWIIKRSSDFINEFIFYAKASFDNGSTWISSERQTLNFVKLGYSSFKAEPESEYVFPGESIVINFTNKNHISRISEPTIYRMIGDDPVFLPNSLVTSFTQDKMTLDTTGLDYGSIGFDFSGMPEPGYTESDSSASVSIITGYLDNPDFAVNDVNDIHLGDDLIIDVEAVDYAELYCVKITPAGSDEEIYIERGGPGTYTISGSIIPAAGQYLVEVMAFADGYGKGYQSETITVLENTTPQHEVTLTVSPDTDLLLYQTVTYTVSAEGATDVKLVFESDDYEEILTSQDEDGNWTWTYSYYFCDEVPVYAQASFDNGSTWVSSETQTLYFEVLGTVAFNAVPDAEAVVKGEPITIRFSDKYKISEIMGPAVTKDEAPVSLSDADYTFDQSGMICDTTNLETGTYQFEFAGFPSEDGYYEKLVTVEVTIVDEISAAPTITAYAWLSDEEILPEGGTAWIGCNIRWELEAEGADQFEWKANGFGTYAVDRTFDPENNVMPDGENWILPVNEYRTGYADVFLSAGPWEGVGSYTFKARAKSGDKAWSNWTEMHFELKSKGDLTAPVFTVNGGNDIHLGDDLTVVVDEVDNAEGYSVDIYTQDREYLGEFTGDNSFGTYTLSGSKIPSAGQYIVSAFVYANGYMPNSAEKMITILEAAPPEVTLTVSPNTDLLLYQDVTYTVKAQGATDVLLVFAAGDYEDPMNLDEYTQPNEDGEWILPWSSYWEGEVDVYAKASFDNGSTWISSESQTLNFVVLGQVSFNATPDSDTVVKGEQIVIQYSEMDEISRVSCIEIYKDEELLSQESPVYQSITASQTKMTCDTANLEPGVYWFGLCGYPTLDGYYECLIRVDVTVIDETSAAPTITAYVLYNGEERLENGGTAWIGSNIWWELDAEGADQFQWKATGYSTQSIDSTFDPNNNTYPGEDTPIIQASDYRTGHVRVWLNNGPWEDVQAYTFQARAKSGDKEWSDWAEMHFEVKSKGNLAEPVFTVNGGNDIHLGDDLTVVVDEVENAETYSVYLFNLDGEVIDESDNYSFGTHTLSGSKIPSAGQYKVGVQADAEGYRWSFAEKTITVLEAAPPAVTLTVSPNTTDLLLYQNVTCTVEAQDAHEAQLILVINGVAEDPIHMRRNNNGTWTATWTVMWEGEAEVYAKASFDNGNWITSDSQTFNMIVLGSATFKATPDAETVVKGEQIVIRFSETNGVRISHPLIYKDGNTVDLSPSDYTFTQSNLTCNTENLDTGTYRFEFWSQPEELGYSEYRVVVEVKVVEKLATPVFTVNGGNDIYLGDDLTVVVEAVENAERYSVSISTPDGGFDEQFTGSSGTYTLSGSKIPSAGQYVVMVSASADGYTGSYADKSITVLEKTTPTPAVTLTVSPNSGLLLYQEVTYTVEAKGATNVQLVYENVTYGYESSWDLNELTEPTSDGKWIIKRSSDFINDIVFYAKASFDNGSTWISSERQTLNFARLGSSSFKAEPESETVFQGEPIVIRFKDVNHVSRIMTTMCIIKGEDVITLPNSLITSSSLSAITVDTTNLDPNSISFEFMSVPEPGYSETDRSAVVKVVENNMAKPVFTVNGGKDIYLGDDLTVAVETVENAEYSVSITTPAGSFDEVFTASGNPGTYTLSGNKIPTAGQYIVTVSAYADGVGRNHTDKTIKVLAKTTPPSDTTPSTDPTPSSDPPAPTKPTVADNYSDPAGTGTYSINTDGTATFRKSASSGKVTIPATVKAANGVEAPVTSIADNAFKNDKKLKTVTIGANVQTIGNKAFADCKALTTVTIGKNVKTIGKNAFAGCKTLKTVKGGANVEAIKDSAFSGCEKLSKLPTFKKLKTIGATAFKGCKALTKITIEAKVSAIGKNAFNGCEKLKTITIKSTLLTKKSVKAGAFKGINAKATVKCPKKKLADYKKFLNSKGVPKTAKIK